MEWNDTMSKTETKDRTKLLLNSRETARMLGISERKLWTMTKERMIPFVRLGRSVRYSIKALESWIEKQLNPGNSYQMEA